MAELEFKTRLSDSRVHAFRLKFTNKDKPIKRERDGEGGRKGRRGEKERRGRGKKGGGRKERERKNERTDRGRKGIKTLKS